MNSKSLLEEAAIASPAVPEPWLALAQHCTHAEDWDGAEKAYAHLHTLLPQHGAIARNWLRAMGEQGKTIRAISIASEMLKKTPDDVAMWKRVATLANEGRHWESEVSAQRNLMRLEPSVPDHAYRMICALLNLNLFDDAKSIRDEARKRWPKDLSFLWLDVATHRAIPRDENEILEDRRASEAALREVESWNFDVSNAFDALGRSHFYSAYHGVNEKHRAIRVAKQIERIVHRQLPYDSFLVKKCVDERREKLRIVMVSHFWYRHTVAHYFGGWVRNLDRAKFEVALAGDSNQRDDISEQVESWADVVLRPSRSQTLMRAIEAWRPDIVIFIDVGMVGKHMPMFAYRLAPLQLATWGHPVTTGFSQIDGFITVAAMEPEDHRAHYSEPEIILLPGQGICYAPPALPQPQTRSFFGLPESPKLLGCAQSLFKIHTVDEALFCEVLRALPDTHMVLFSLAETNATEDFRVRFFMSLARYGVANSRVTLLPQIVHASFLQVLMQCDVMLDTHHFSGGKTSMDALACGTPIVTWPGEFMRGRQTAGMLTLMNATEFIASNAEEYVAIVKKTVNERSAISRDEIRQKASVLWNDLAPVRALERALVETLEKKLGEIRI